MMHFVVVYHDCIDESNCEQKHVVSELSMTCCIKLSFVTHAVGLIYFLNCQTDCKNMHMHAFHTLSCNL